MQLIYVSDSDAVRDGLDTMMQATLGQIGLIQGYIEIHVALFIIEAAKRAPDLPSFFPRGKWATIQALQSRIDEGFDVMRNDEQNNEFWKTQKDYSRPAFAGQHRGMNNGKRLVSHVDCL